MESWGDTFKKLNEQSRKYTYTKHERKKNKEDPLLMDEHCTATRIDHIIVSPNMINKILKSDIIQKHYINTDHNPIKCTIQINGNIISTEYQLINEEAYTCKYKDKNLTVETEALLKNNLIKEWHLIDNKIRNWSQESAKTNYTLMEQAIHNAARDSLEAIERGKKKAKHTTGNKKLGQIIKARRVTIKQRNRILHALINKQNFAISFKLPPTTNRYCQSIPIYPHNTSETPTENQTRKNIK